MAEKIKRATTLIIGDNELNCNCEEVTIQTLSIADVGLNVTILDQFDLVLYNGKKGLKLLKSKWTGTGVIS